MLTEQDLFESFDRVNILVIGDVMIDRYLRGSVERISPEAPVPVVNLKRKEDRLGGAANVALNLAALGASPFLCSVVGHDEASDTFLGLLPDHGLPAAGLVRSGSRPTTVKTRIMSGNQHLLRIDEESTANLNETEEQALLEAIERLLDQHDIRVILFQDYNKGVLSASVIRRVGQLARARGIFQAVDPKDKNFWAYEGVTLFKPNLREIQQQVDFQVKPTLESLSKAGAYIHSRLQNRFSLITLSDKGVFLYGEGIARIFPTHPRLITDVCGAGDTVISVASVALAAGLSWEQTAILANLAGGQVCEKVGVVPVDKQQLLAEYQQLNKVGDRGDD